MDVTTACEIINDGLSPRPGYTHRAYPYDHRQADTVVVRISQPNAHASDREEYPAYDRRIDLQTDFAVYVGDATDVADIAYALVGAYLQFESHEIREFVRTPDGASPLHPHIREGQQAWSERTARPIDLDVAYGVQRIRS